MTALSTYAPLFTEENNISHLTQENSHCFIKSWKLLKNLFAFPLLGTRTLIKDPFGNTEKNPATRKQAYLELGVD